MIELTVREQQRARYWHRRSRDRVTPRRLLRESDELMFWLEECLLQRLRIVPGWLMPRLVQILASAGDDLSRRAGSERRPAELIELLYQAQGRLMEESVRSRRPARIVPLFRSGSPRPRSSQRRSPRQEAQR
ncbi:MAG TPA: hypothetical protein VKY90_09935 [Candidatus Dormibacteraeota bacterium]|nr:hypothetical protein [Candidatus Dormibacteraeota bacterium]